MNERIQELLTQAKELVRKELEYHPAALLPQELVDAKFAELLIQECAHLVGGYLKEDEFGTDVKEAYEEITKHFGVEQ